MSKRIKYSQEFKKLTKTKKGVKKLLRGSNFKGENFNLWENERAFIADTIHKDGKILDVGCGNGFLLRCLMEWAKYELIPYGIDSNGDYILEAKKLFSYIPENFARIGLEHLDYLKDLGLPKFYDLVYWSVADDWKFKGYRETRPLEMLLKMLNERGRLILGFYDSKKENTARIKKLKGLGFYIAGICENPYKKSSVIIAWIDKSP